MIENQKPVLNPQAPVVNPIQNTTGKKSADYEAGYRDGFSRVKTHIDTLNQDAALKEVQGQSWDQRKQA